MSADLRGRVLSTLEEEGLLAEPEAVYGFFHPQKRIWYLEAVLAFSAITAAISFMIFVSTLGLISRSDTAWIVLGFVFLGISLALYRFEDIRFLVYMAPALNLGGLGMVLVGWAIVSQSYGQVVLVNGLLCFALFLFRDKLLRFLWFSVFFGVLIGWLFAETHEMGLSLFIVMATLGAVYFFGLTRMGENRRPIGYAVAVAAAGAAAFSLLPHDVWEGNSPVYWWPARIGVFAIMAGYLWRLKTDENQMVPFLWMLAGLALIASVTTPALLTALALLILGYAARESLLFCFAAVSFACSLWLYYYFLDVSLLVKSAYLFLTGTVLLLTRFLIRRFGEADDES